MKPNYTLYLVTEESIPLEQLLQTIEEAVKGGVTIVQLREKSTSGKNFFQKAMRVKALLNQYEVPLIINDRIDVAIAIEADGVHVGQSDLPVAAVRNIVPASMLVGVSVSTIEEAKEAEDNGADYIGVGAVFPTHSKKDAEVLPEGMLERITNAVTIPAIAIGGITLKHLPALRRAGIAGVAIVSGIMKAKDPYDAAMAYQKEWTIR
ncbi:thiamine-phosphate pyrophosphorylase [Cytobacillus eiseniae]|uniref:Thiamine-phosphate synthase n=1 Tax=Cytobacillus eiseniae TaxID=762947 RepID=A0ABS4RA96_9BACI|nr:thiamine phosphate synthase [Cytobacillus eiseniae]MBP2239817.1 thiamine-phosphate pyrophosphorylase [Cytobacillus eiseniae]